MTAQQIVSEIEPLGTEGYRRVLRNHGITGPLFGVKIEELKKYEKAIKKDYRLALDLFDTGVYDEVLRAGQAHRGQRKLRPNSSASARSAASNTPNTAHALLGLKVRPVSDEHPAIGLRPQRLGAACRVQVGFIVIHEGDDREPSSRRYVNLSQSF
ncbi:MAG: hypothetical protein ACR2HJ_06830 [Fimbriimonadales bacterium]